MDRNIVPQSGGAGGVLVKFRLLCMRWSGYPHLRANGAPMFLLERLRLKGSWDLVTRVIIKVTVLISAYNPN